MKLSYLQIEKDVDWVSKVEGGKENKVKAGMKCRTRFSNVSAIFNVSNKQKMSHYSNIQAGK